MDVIKELVCTIGGLCLVVLIAVATGYLVSLMCDDISDRENSNSLYSPELSEALLEYYYTNEELSAKSVAFPADTVTSADSLDFSACRHKVEELLK